VETATNSIGRERASRQRHSVGPVRYLLGHGFAANSPREEQWVCDWLARLRAAGVDVHPTRLNLNVRGGRLTWPELDRRWRRGDRELLSFYERLAHELEGFDVLINSGGLNLHPEFLRQLSVLTVLGFYDDPEASDDCSRPVAAAHDLCLVGNVAELDTYRNWGVTQVHWWPCGFRADDYDPTMTLDGIVARDRDVDVALLCERRTHYRRRRVDKFAAAFPQGVYRGRGWPQGFLPEEERVPLLQRTKVGINIHNSTGPINFRTFYLPANGVLQVCDNRSHLGQIFALGREVVGFETIDEAIELCRYYLAHDDARREIAAAGWRRALADYNEVASFHYLVRAVESYRVRRAKPIAASPSDLFVGESLRNHRRSTRGRRVLHRVAAPFLWPQRRGFHYARGFARRVTLLLDNARYLLRGGLKNILVYRRR
jgi:spore maturation protein CgeB